MIAAYATLRILGLLRRIARALERSADADSVRAHLLQSDWDARHAPRPLGKVTVSLMDPAAANAVWHESRRAQGLEDEEGNEL